MTQGKATSEGVVVVLILWFHQVEEHLLVVSSTFTLHCISHGSLVHTLVGSHHLLQVDLKKYIDQMIHLIVE